MSGPAQRVADQMQLACRAPLLTATGRTIGEVVKTAGLTPAECCVLFADLLAGAIRMGPRGGQEEVAVALFLDRHAHQMERPETVRFTVGAPRGGTA